MSLEYTIEVGYDTHVSAGHESYVASTPEEAIERRGTNFHPDFNCVVRREIGTTQWHYYPEDQVYNYSEKLKQYREARE